MKNLYKSLALFQQECPVILKETAGYGYNYSDLPAIFKIILPLLKKHGLGFTQYVSGDKLGTTIFHIDSGEELSQEADIPQGVTLKGMNDFQVLGSAITYMRRYQLSSMLGIVTDKDNDAHGEQLNGVSNSYVQKIVDGLLAGQAQTDRFYPGLKQWKTTKKTIDLTDDQCLMISDAIVVAKKKYGMPTKEDF